jgi:hypothetical protein
LTNNTNPRKQTMLDSKDNALRIRFEKEKKFKLFIALGIDLLGMLSYLIPGLGEIFDLAIAPISAILVFVLFGRKLKWAAFTFIEELVPMTDVIPSATIAWYSMYVTNEIETISEMNKREKLKQKMFDNLDGN